MVSACVRRKEVSYVRGRGISLRRACALLRVARSTIGYESTLAQRDAPVVAAMRELAAQYPRFGYRRIQVFLARRGLTMSADRAYRIWRKAGLQVPRRRPRRRVATSRPRPLPATGADQVWAYDFVFDACANGAQLKCLTVIDEFTRECLAIDVAGSIRSGRVIEVLSKLIACVERRSTCGRTTDRSSCQERFCNGCTRRASRLHPSILESPGRMARTRASTESSETSASGCSGSRIESMRRS